jgi:predicted outer membrane lipoprotein
MDIATVLMSCVFIIVTAVTIILIEHIFGLSIWISCLLGVPLGWAFVILCVYLLAKIAKK